MKKCKEWLFSETGMRVINVLFFLMMILRAARCLGRWLTDAGACTSLAASAGRKHGGKK